MKPLSLQSVSDPGDEEHGVKVDKSLDGYRKTAHYLRESGVFCSGDETEMTFRQARRSFGGRGEL